MKKLKLRAGYSGGVWGKSDVNPGQCDLQNLFYWSLATQSVVLGTAAPGSLLEMLTLRPEPQIR